MASLRNLHQEGLNDVRSELPAMCKPTQGSQNHSFRESQNTFGWKKPPQPSHPTFDPALQGHYQHHILYLLVNKVLLVMMNCPS